MIAESAFRLLPSVEVPVPRRLLVVDEAEESRQTLADYFEARGYEVLVAADGLDALVQAIRRSVDTVIMSASLPGLEGYEAAGILRKVIPGLRIILTVEPDAERHRHASRRRERFRCFAKPLELEGLAAELESGRAAPEAKTDEEGPR